MGDTLQADWLLSDHCSFRETRGLDGGRNYIEDRNANRSGRKRERVRRERGEGEIERREKKGRKGEGQRD